MNIAYILYSVGLRIVIWPNSSSKLLWGYGEQKHFPYINIVPEYLQEYGKKRMKKLTSCVKGLPVTVGKTDSAWKKLMY